MDYNQLERASEGSGKMEVTLYNKKGKPVAYIANDGETIYLWEGRAVAYLYDEKVYGWNGSHLGWFHNGIVYDLHGLRVGSIRSKCPVVTSVEPIKSVKFVKSVKSVGSVPSVKPIFSSGYSDEDLGNFLEERS